jgi:rare lipoprotein A
MSTRLGAIRLGLKGTILVAVLSLGCARPSSPSESLDAESDRSPRVVKTLRGYATFYGAAFAGQRTASGRRFDPAEMVAAHRTLPLGTRVRVTNLENGRSVVLRVIDRGPYARRGTIIDVSHGAAKRLRFVRDGRVRVKVEVFERSSRPADAGGN